MVVGWFHCGPRCRSKAHARWLHSSLTKSVSDDSVIICLAKCYNSGSNSDEYGRTAVHIAAACGRTKAIDWLFDNVKTAINSKDHVSGWTPLHYAVYYGQIETTVHLLAAGANLSSKDWELFTPLDLMILDVGPYTTLSNCSDIYTWGDNATYILGHANGQSRTAPECLQLFLPTQGSSSRGTQMSVVDVAITKYSTFFLTSCGRVFACGSGRGGRLGLGNEQTVIAPMLMSGSKKVVSLATSTSHVIFVTTDGQVFVAGSNEHHQMGLPTGSDKEINPKPIRFGKKDVRVKSVACGTFHSVVITDTDAYSCGLNAGQMGFAKDVISARISEFRLVTALTSAIARNAEELEGAGDQEDDKKRALLAACDSATIVKTSPGDLYILYGYSCKKILSGWQGIIQVAVAGGRLDHTVAPGVLKAEKGSDLRVVALVESGQVLLWRERESTSSWHALHFNGLGRDLQIASICSAPVGLHNCILVVSQTGEAFSAVLSNSSTSTNSVPKDDNWIGHRKAGGSRRCEIELTGPVRRIRQIHRARRIYCDSQMANFACLIQRPESTFLPDDLPQMSSNDLAGDMNRLLTSSSCADVELKFSSPARSIMAHRVILASSSSHFYHLFIGSPEQKVFSLTDVDPVAFSLLIKFCYTGQIDLSEYLVTCDTTSGFQEQQKTSSIAAKSGAKKSSGSSKKKQNPGNGTVSECALINSQLLIQLADLAKRFGFVNGILCNELEKLRNDLISGRTKSICQKLQSSAKIKLSRDISTELADVWLRSTEGQEFPTNRYILAARSDYFSSMLAFGRWAEAGRAVISQSAENSVLDLVLDYLYSDWLGEVTDWRLLCKLIVYADQVFLTDLKSVAELQLSMTPRLSVSNCCKLIDFAMRYRTPVLLAAAQRFAIANMPCLLENSLESLIGLDPASLSGLSEAYRKVVVPHRRVEPWSKSLPTEDDIADIVKDAKQYGFISGGDEIDMEAFATFFESLTSERVSNGDSPSGIINGTNGRSGKARRNRRRSGNNSESSDTTTPAATAPSTPQALIKVSAPSANNSARQSPIPELVRQFSSGGTPGVSIPLLTKALESSKLSMSSSQQSLSTSSPKVVSFLEIMADQEKQELEATKYRRPRQTQLTSSATTPVPVATSSNSSPVATPSRPKSWSIVPPPLPQLPPSSPLTALAFPPVMATRSPPLLPSGTSMAEILRHEERQLENRLRRDRRTLQQIQIEERAIAELGQIYSDLELQGVIVTVEIASAAADVAAPIWAPRATGHRLA